MPFRIVARSAALKSAARLQIRSRAALKHVLLLSDLDLSDPRSMYQELHGTGLALGNARVGVVRARYVNHGLQTVLQIGYIAVQVVQQLLERAGRHVQVL